MSHLITAWSWLLAAVLLAAAAAYLTAVVVVRRAGGWWPWWRVLCWGTGTIAAVAVLLRPAHDFTAHMAGHLTLGMAAPLLLVLAAPVTLALRALPVRAGRAVSRVLGSPPARFVTHPVTAAVLDAGGLWLLYTTGLHASVNPIVPAHVLAAGYLLTAAVIGVDPAPRRPGRPVRAVVLIAFLAAHGILAKYVYAHPPAGVPAAAAEAGAQLMYYGGDLIHLAVIAIFCHQWYTATDPRGRTAAPRIRMTPPARPPWRLPADLRTGREGGSPSAL
ncbi:cytochrome c oxidase assembly protein [Actinoplanes sp. NPDC051633]|uniref:cytochrome c oxidase assembly protein n=1 Tax=Actinoplanes sp. NPDC051633 TaxID=3155670 RepID=UPI00343C71ED